MLNEKEHCQHYVEISESDEPSKESIWANLYRCRDLELTSLWQKSIFLFSFIMLCFTGYGALLLKTTEKDANLVFLYEYMLGISILGIILSYIWLTMVKGSKAWYEVYEKTIYQLETEIFDSAKDKAKYVEGEYAKVFRDKMDDKLFLGFNGGPFSPSKVNLFIGNLLLIIWIVCSVICILNLLIGLVPDIMDIPNYNSFILLLLIVVLLYAIFRMPYIIKNYSKSGPLAKYDNPSLKEWAIKLINSKIDIYSKRHN